MIRASFDIGSGSTKLQVCEVEVSKEKSVIVKTLFGQERLVVNHKNLLKH